MNNVKIKKFLGMEVRIVNEEYIVLKDVFSALGRLDNKTQIVSTDRNKLQEFLIDINKLCDSKTFTITSKSKKIKIKRLSRSRLFKYFYYTNCINSI